MTFLLAHLSDAHIGPLPAASVRELAGKRLTGWINWNRGRSRLHSMETLSQITADILAHRPHHVAMTGDIMNLGLPGEFPQARSWLSTLGPFKDVSFVPGNHDAYVKSAMPNVVRVFAPWTGDPGEGLYPYMRVRDRVALIGLSSGVPTGPFLASGRVGAAQMEAFANLLRKASSLGYARVVMIHHPPYRGGATPGRGLQDARAFEEVIARWGAELVIHGHNHRRSERRLQAPGGTVPVIGVASASAVPGSEGHRAGWHAFTLQPTSEGWRIDLTVRGFANQSTQLATLASERLA